MTAKLKRPPTQNELIINAIVTHWDAHQAPLSAQEIYELVDNDELLSRRATSSALTYIYKTGGILFKDHTSSPKKYWPSLMVVAEGGFSTKIKEMINTSSYRQMHKTTMHTHTTGSHNPDELVTIQVQVPRSAIILTPVP